MSLNLDQKKVVVEEVAAVAARAHSVIAAEYAGLSVAALTNLRRTARAVGVHMRVVRNTLARRALADTQFACMTDGLVGQLVLAFSEGDPGAGARVIGDFARTNDKLKVRLVAFGGKLLPPEALGQLASMPTREQALAMLMGVMLAPVSQLVRTIAEPHARLVRTVGAIRDQKQAA